jgi:Tfp pilus assembly protein PilO
MKLNLGEIIPTRNVIYFSLSFLGIFVFILLAILPYQKTLVGSDRRIEELKLRIEEQRNFSVFYQSLTKSMKQKDSMALPAPKKEKLSRAQMEKIPAQVRAIARNSRMGVDSIIPDLKTQTPDSLYLPVDITVTGKLKYFRNFLIGLEALPYLEHIEEIQIQKIPESKEFKVRVWLAIGP